jgi:hypothetical protein
VTLATLIETIKSKRLVRKALIGFALAAAGGLGTLVAKAAYEKASQFINPSPYKFLEGRYFGHWIWTGPNQHPEETNDVVFFESTADGKLIGHGTDPQLGTYAFHGNLYKTHVSAAYLSDAGSAQPAQSGGFELELAKRKPLVLTGVWTGFYNGGRISGTVTLTKQPD